MGKKNKKIPKEVATEPAKADSDVRPEHQQNGSKFEGHIHKQQQQHQQLHRDNTKRAFTRIAVDPTRKYHQPEERESWGPNVKGKKFRKEKGKKKRCPNAGHKIDGEVRSIQFK